MNLIKIPLCNGLGKTIGCEKAPAKIVDAIKQFYLTEDLKIPVFNTKTIFVDNNNIELSNKQIIETITGVDKGIIIGGDHSITNPCFTAFSKNKLNPGIIIFDAHPDLEVCTETPTHEDFLRDLIIKKVIKSENIILIGIRNMSKNEMAFLKEKKIRYFNMRSFEYQNEEVICDEVMSFAKNFSDLYLSIDIDVLDPAFAPGTGYQEPGGLTTRQLLYFLHRIKNLKNLKMFDLVEVNPNKDINELTVKTAAKLVVELSIK